MKRTDNKQETKLTVSDDLTKKINNSLELATKIARLTKDSGYTLEELSLATKVIRSSNLID